MKFIENSKFDRVPTGRCATVINGMMNAFEQYHKNTATHSVLVAKIAVELAWVVGYRGEELIEIKEAALMHDIGKLKIPLEILSAPRKLTDEEFDTMKTHAAIGATMLEQMGLPKFYVEVAALHHERIDGRGYNKLDASKLSKVIRLMVIADSFAAMYERRDYKDPCTKDFIIEQLIKCSGEQFDTEMVVQFLEHIEAVEQDQIPEDYYDFQKQA